MKLAFRLRSGAPLTHAEAVGYAQIAASLVGFAVTAVGFVTTLPWFITTAPRMQEMDPEAAFIAFWRHIRWPLLGIAIFVFSLLWGLATSFKVLSEHPKQPVPPRI